MQAVQGADLDRAAERIADARLQGTPVERLVEAENLADGYAVQERANSLLEASLGARAGHKIGGTNKEMQVYLGCHEPLAGEVFATTVHASGARLPFDRYRRPGIETEIAVLLGRPLPARPEPYAREEVAGAVAEVMAAIELVDDRYVDFRSTGAPTIAADNAFNAASALGEPLREPASLDLAHLRARTFIDGNLVAEGTSAALLGHPLEALLWLAEHRRRLGLGLAAGSFVSLGSMTPVQWLSRPAVARIEVEGLGEVELELTGD
jgi:2-keto-4-pentenoate hydratase